MTVNKVKLTPEQERQWSEAKSLFMWTAPGFYHLFYKLLVNNEDMSPNREPYAAVFTDSVPTAATDAKNILVNPDWFFKKALTERVFALAHEVVHNVYGDVQFHHACQKAGTVPMHDGSTLPYHEGTIQAAFDYRINAMLEEARIGKPPAGVYLDKNIATGADSVIDTYKKIFDPDDPESKYPSGQGSLMVPGSGSGLAPDQAQHNQQIWAIELAKAQAIEKMSNRWQGRLPGQMQQMFDDILHPKVPWYEYIRTEMARRVGSGSYDWKRPDRRLIVRDIYAPGRSGHGAGWLVVWGDTSGSMYGDLDKQFAELVGMFEDVKPRRITVYWHDDGPVNEDYMDDMTDVSDLYAVRARGVHGGGGTSCVPVFDHIVAQHDRPDMMICLTDTYTDFPDEQPPFPVIWAVTISKEDAEKRVPWGDVVVIED